MALERAGFLKTTLLDYPGEVASTIFTPGCNLRCPYCHNADLISPPYPEDLVPLDDIMAHIRRRKELLGGVCITGGEPLMHADLPDLARAIRKEGLKVKLDTNGLFPDRLAHFPADYVAMDLKSSPAGYALLGYTGSGDPASLIRKSIRYLKEAGAEGKLEYEFRTTFVPGIVNRGDFQGMAELLRGAQRYVLAPFRPGKTLDAAYAGAAPYSDQDMEEFRSYFEEVGNLNEVVLRGQ